MDGPQGEVLVDAASARGVKYALGLIGLLVGAIGLATAATGPRFLEAFKRPEPQPQKLADKLAEAGDRFVGRMIDRVRGKKVEPIPEAPAPARWDRYLSLAGSGLGLVGAFLGTAGWIRREDHRLAVSAMATGFLAVAWLYLMAALVIAMVIVILLILFALFEG